MKQFILIVMSILGSFFGMSAQESDHIKVLEVKEFKEEITKSNVQLIDVRTAQEYDSGHIKNAVHIDFYQSDKFVAFFKTLDKSKPIYLYCRSGSRSRNASKILEDLGFQEIYDLKGGILGYK